jgi:hypothetical protein
VDQAATMPSHLVNKSSDQAVVLGAGGKKLAEPYK